MVVDTSILIAIFFNERWGPWATDQLQTNRAHLRMSVVNHTEGLILIADRAPQRLAEIRETIDSSGIRIVPPTMKHAEIAAAARLRYPLNLGDCFAYALAKDEECGLLTLDRDFRRFDLTVVLPRR